MFDFIKTEFRKHRLHCLHAMDYEDRPTYNHGKFVDCVEYDRYTLYKCCECGVEEWRKDKLSWFMNYPHKISGYNPPPKERKDPPTPPPRSE